MLTASSRRTMKETYVDAAEAGQRLGCSRSTARRAAVAAGVGIYVRGKLVAIPAVDISKMRPFVRDTPGNPDWIAAGKKRTPPPK